MPSILKPSRSGRLDGQQLLRRCIEWSCLVLLGVYWLSTLLYVMPNNYLRILAYDWMQGFETVFAQRWEFFAPPAKFDTRVFAIFTPYDPQQHPEAIREFTAELAKERRRRAPFDAGESFLDYIVSTAADHVRTALAQKLK